MNHLQSLLIMFLLASAALGQDLHAGLIAHYPLDGDGSNAVGAFCPGSVVGATATTDRFGHPGRALNFNGIGDHVWLGGCSLPTNQISMALWFRTTTTQSGTGTAPVLLRWRTFGLLIYLNRTGATGELSGVICVGDACPSARAGDPPLNDGEWHHAAVVYDGSTLSLYIDGVLMDDTPLSGAIRYGAGGLAFGRDGDRNGGFYDGDLDDVRLYDRALTATEVALLASLQPADVDKDGCIDISDLAVLLADFGCASSCQGDVDGDGGTTLSDLAEVLANFGQGC